MADDGTRTIPRRAIIAAGAAGAAALAAQAAGAVLGPGAVRAADGDPVAIGKDNAGTGSTWVTTAGASPSLGGRSTTGDGVTGSSSGDAKSGVYGTSGHAKGYGIFGRNLVSHAYGFLGGPSGVGATGPDGLSRGALGSGLNGCTGENVATGNVGFVGSPEGGVIGVSPNSHTIGVLGYGNAGVLGRQGDDIQGVLGTETAGVIGTNPKAETTGTLAAAGAAVIGTNSKAATSGALGATEAGVRAISGGAKPALVVEGGVQLMRGGVAVVPKGKISVRITRSTVGFPEAAVAVLQAYRAGVAVAATVVNQAAGTVTIYLTKKVTVDTSVAYFLFGTAGMQ